MHNVIIHLTQTAGTNHFTVGYNLNSGGVIQNPIMVTHQYNTRIILLMIASIDRRNKGTASDMHFICEHSEDRSETI